MLILTQTYNKIGNIRVQWKKGYYNNKYKAQEKHGLCIFDRTAEKIVRLSANEIIP